MVFRFILITFVLFTSPARAEVDCRSLLSFGGQEFTAAAALELSDADLSANIPKAAVRLFDALAETGANFAKLERVLRENWLIQGGALTEGKIRPAITDAYVAYVTLTFDFFTAIEQKLAAKPELAQEIRAVVLAGLRARVTHVETAREAEQQVIQNVRSIDPRFEPTSTGAVFKPVDDPMMGESVEDQDGLIWSEMLLGLYNNVGKVKAGIITGSDATRACESIGGRLPTYEDYEKLRRYFEVVNDEMTPQGRADFHRIFPDMNRVDKKRNYFTFRQFLSSSVHPQFPKSSYALHGKSGYIGPYIRRRFTDMSPVKCVRGSSR